MCIRDRAEGAARVCGADLGLSVTGLSGPDTDGSDNPIGLVYLGASYKGKTTVTVSYTHLDVYKRQITTTARWS